MRGVEFYWPRILATDDDALCSATGRRLLKDGLKRHDAALSGWAVQFPESPEGEFVEIEALFDACEKVLSRGDLLTPSQAGAPKVRAAFAQRISGLQIRRSFHVAAAFYPGRPREPILTQTVCAHGTHIRWPDAVRFMQLIVLLSVEKKHLHSDLH